MSTTSGLWAAAACTTSLTRPTTSTTSIPSARRRPASASAKTWWSSQRSTRTARDTRSSMQPPDTRLVDTEGHRALVGDLAEQLTHELANRLAVARLTAEVLGGHPDLPPALAERVSTVVSATG